MSTPTSIAPAAPNAVTRRHNHQPLINPFDIVPILDEDALEDWCGGGPFEPEAEGLRADLWLDLEARP